MQKHDSHNSHFNQQKEDNKENYEQNSEKRLFYFFCKINSLLENN